MHKVADRVKEQTTTVGTGTYSLDGAIAGHRTFVAGVGDGSECYYSVTDGTDWEVGIGTVTDGAPDTLTRDEIYSSSNADAAVNWSAGIKNIFIANPSRNISGLARLYIRNVSNTQDATAQTAVSAGVTTTLKLTGTGSNNFLSSNIDTGKLELDPTYDGNNGGLFIDQIHPESEISFRLTLVNTGAVTTAVPQIFLVFSKGTPGAGVAILSPPISFPTGVEVPIEFSAYRGDIEAVKVRITSDNARTYRVNGLKAVVLETSVGEG
jgi:hypothetical protein